MKGQGRVMGHEEDILRFQKTALDNQWDDVVALYEAQSRAPFWMWPRYAVDIFFKTRQYTVSQQRYIQKLMERGHKGDENGRPLRYGTIDRS